MQLLQNYKYAEVNVDNFVQTSIKTTDKKILIKGNENRFPGVLGESNQPFSRNIHIHE